MARIKIEDLPKDLKISTEEMKRIIGGWGPFDLSHYTRSIFSSKKHVGIIIGGIGGPGDKKRPPLYEFPEGSIPPDDWF